MCTKWFLLFTNPLNMETKVKLLARHIHQSAIPGGLLCSRHLLGTAVAQWEWLPRLTKPADQSYPSAPGCGLTGCLCTEGTALTFIFMALLIERWGGGGEYMSVLNTPLYKSDKRGTGVREKGNWAKSWGSREISPDIIFDLRWERWTRVNGAVCVCVRETGAKSGTQAKGRRSLMLKALQKSSRTGAQRAKGGAVCNSGETRPPSV